MRTCVLRNSLAAAAIVVLFTTLPRAAPAQRGSGKAVPSFTEEVLHNFTAWDTDHDGMLSQDELEAVISNPATRAEAAAAAAILKMIIHGGRYVIPSLTRDYFSTYDEYTRTQYRPNIKVLGLTGTEFADFSSAEYGMVNPANPSTEYPPYAGFYASAVLRVKATPVDLFIGDAPSLLALKQGQIADCYFLAIVGAMLNRDPGEIRKMIATNPDGSYDVTFPCGKRIHVAPLSDGEIALGSGSSGTGRWVSVLESAYDTLRIGLATPGTVSTFHIDSISRGGEVRSAMRAVDGPRIDTLLLRNADVHSMPDAATVNSKLPRVRKIIGLAMADHRLVCASTSGIDVPTGITPDHAFAVIGFDADSDTITLWNPHGQNYAPIGEVGVNHGYPANAGIFKVPVVDFARIFSWINWEVEQTPPTDTSPAAPTPEKHVRGLGLG